MPGDSALQINDLYGHQKREWRFQAIGLAALVALVVAALGGLFGHGPLSWDTARSPSGALEVATPRFARLGGNVRLKVTATPELASGQSFHVVLDQDWAEHMGAQRFRPEPYSVEIDGDRMILMIARSDPGAPLEMAVDLNPAELWSTSGDIRVGDESVTVHHFVYP